MLACLIQFLGLTNMSQQEAAALSLFGVGLSMFGLSIGIYSLLDTARKIRFHVSDRDPSPSDWKDGDLWFKVES